MDQLIVQIVIIASIFAVFYLLLIRPQTQRQKERKQLIDDLKNGDEIITVGGIVGTIKEINDKTMILKTGDVELNISRSAVGSKLAKETGEIEKTD